MKMKKNFVLGKKKIKLKKFHHPHGSLIVSILFLLLLLLFPGCVWGEEEEKDNEYYQEQLESSGAKDLPDSLPDETKKLLEGFGVDDFDKDNFLNITPEKIFSQTMKIAGEQSKDPLRAVISVVGIMILCSFLQSMKVSFGERDLSKLFGVVCVLMTTALIVTPVLSCIEKVSSTIHGSFLFMSAFIPVLGGVMTANGQPITATSYSFVMLGASETTSALCANLILPMLHIILALSIVSSAAPRLNTSGITAFLQKAVKWILGFSMSVFVSIMSLQSVVGSSADNVAVKAAKFVIGSAVPVVGGALSEAFSSVQSYIGLLKTTVGAFGIIAGACVFLPVIIQIILWQLGMQLCIAIGDMMGLSEISGLLKAISGVLGLLLAVVLCCALLIVISTGIMLTIGGIK